MQRWIEERHSGVVGTIVAVGDYIAGLPSWVTGEYNRAENQFGNDIGERLLLDISSEVNGVIAAAQAIIVRARTDIGALFDQMEAEFPGVRGGRARQVRGPARRAVAAGDRRPDEPSCATCPGPR